MRMYLLSLENVRMTGSGQNDATGCAILETMESLVWFCEARIASYSVEQAKYLKLRHRIMYFEGLEENYQCTLRLKAAKNVGIHLDREHVWNKLTLTFDDINAIHSEYHKDIVDREGEDSELEWDFNLGVLAALRALEHLWEDLHDIECLVWPKCARRAIPESVQLTKARCKGEDPFSRLKRLASR